VDLVALRWDFSFPIEVKSSSENVIRFSKNPRLAEQADKMIDECEKASLIPVYAYRLKGFRGDPWRLFSLPTGNPLKGRTALIKRRIPEIEMNSNGNFIMRWENGIKLSKFIDYMTMTASDLADTPNAETLEAIAEVERMKKDPSIGKAYTDVDEMMRELLSDD
jgi:hypothetical protein